MSAPPPASGRRSPWVTLLLALTPLAAAAGGYLFLKWNQPADGLLDPQAADSRPAPTPAVPANTEEAARSWELKVPPAPSQGFVGSAACRDCHASIFDRYQASGMAQSLSQVSGLPPREAQSPHSFTHSERTYRVEERDGAVVHCEALLDETGAPIYDQSVPVQFAMGSGHKGKSYLFNRGGLLFMSPVSWYAEGNRFDLSPGYRPDQGDRFERRISSRCLSCHVGQVNSASQQLDRYGDPPFVELSIGCERCHGPGEQHIALRQGDRGEIQNDPIVNPSRLQPELREAVCNQCHLLGADEILRYGRTDFDFRPGMHLSDVWTLFLEPAVTHEDGTPRAVSQVEQMRSSRCFRLSDGRLGCTSCHDPHETTPVEQRAAFYRGKCLTCHSDQGCTLPEDQRRVQNDSCIACHMPPNTENDIPHVSQTNHGIIRSLEAGGVPRSRNLRRQSELFVDGAQVPAIDLQRARGITSAKTAEARRDEELAASAITLLEPIAAANPSDVAAAAAIARCYQVLGKPQDAAPLWREVLLQDPENEEALLSMAQMHHRAGQYKQSLQFLDEFLKLNEWPAHAQGLRAQLRERLDNLDGALESARLALERDPTRVTAYLWLEQACARAGQTADADRYRALRERLEQRLPAAKTPKPAADAPGK